MEKDNYSIEINNLITLCYILDDFKDFEKRLLSNISPKYNRDFIFQLWDISRGKFKLGAKKAKKFYNENKTIIDTINNFTNVPTFINQSYGWHGESNENFQYFYKYLLNHKDDIPKILILLEKLKELGFHRFEFNEDLDFTKEKYNASPAFDRNFYITYVANPEVIPTYDNYINYRTSNSNYKMKLDILGITNKDFSEYSRKIILNSLLFDPFTLPKKIDKEHIFTPILIQKNEQKEKDAIIRNSVDLSVSILDLDYRFNLTNRIINELDNVQNKEELIKTLANIKDNLEKLKTLSKEYNNDASQKEPSLTEEVLENEKQLYLKQREWSKIDLD